MLKRPMPGERNGPVEDTFQDEDFAKFYPTLSAYLTETKYADGAPRTTATMLIFCENGVLRLCVNDRDNNRSVFFTNATVTGVFMAAENALCSQTADWRVKSYGRNSSPQTPF